MILLEAQQIHYEIQGKTLLDIALLHIQKGDQIGVVGKNGSGKTTLLNVLSEKKPLATGSIRTMASSSLLPQLNSIDTTKSGGEVTQMYIDNTLAAKPDILFADEPTTNLDQRHIEKLETHLKRWIGALVIVSHDRAFLDSLCNQIWEIKDTKVTVYQGNYSDYEKQRDLQLNQQQQAYEQYVRKKRQLENALEQKKRKAARAVKAPKKGVDSDSKQIGAKPYFAKKQKNLEATAKAIETRIEQLETVEKVHEEKPLKMDLPEAAVLKNRVIIRFDEMEGKIGIRRLWHKVSFHIHAGDKVAVIGDNGTGKTTLVKKIMAKAAGIKVSPAVKIGYFSQDLDILQKNKTILENVASTSLQETSLICTVLAQLHFFKEDVNKPINVLSGGERVKVAFAKLFVSDVNTLILDEPTNFLDIDAIKALESLLNEYAGAVLFVSHDRRFIKQIATRIVSINNQQIDVFAGNYDAYQNQQVHVARQDTRQEQLLLINTKLSEVLSRISLEPNSELELEFQRFLQEKRKLESSLKMVNFSRFRSTCESFEITSYV